MIQVPPNANVVVMHEAINFRYGIEGTAAIARTVLEKEPMDGAFFVFRNRRKHMLRVLFYDGSGFWLCTKRLSKGCFSAWPAGDGTCMMACHQAITLVWCEPPCTASSDHFTMRSSSYEELRIICIYVNMS